MILITGGTGIVGAHVLFELVNDGCSVRALQRETSSKQLVKDVFNFYSPNGKSLFDSIEWVTGDLEDVTSLDLACEGITEVFHCAALVSFRSKDFKKLIKVNAEGTANLVNVCLTSKVKEFYYISSVAAIGRSAKSQVITENTEWETSKENSGYAISKHLAEMEVWRGGEEGMNISMVNPTIVLGPGNTDESSGTLFRSIKEGQSFYTHGANGFVDARDVAFCMKRLYDEKLFNERFILVGENKGYKEIAETMATNLGVNPPSKLAKPWATSLAWKVSTVASWFTRKPPKFSKETAKSSQQRMEYSNEKVRKDLGITFRTAEQAIKNSVAFFREFPSYL